MNTPVLDLDTLLLTLSLADVSSTKLALMSTCQVLYHEGGKLFLKNEPVWITTDHHLQSFLLFMSADGFSRLRHLRDLTLGIKTPSGQTVERLKNMFVRLAPVSQLKSLGIHYTEVLLSAHPPLSTAITELTTIESIHWSGAGKRSLGVLKSMRSELVDVYLELCSNALYDLEDEADGDAIHLLRNSKSSLQVLRVAHGGNTVEAEDAPQHPLPQYPVLKGLVLEWPYTPYTSHYVRAFPNLAWFHLGPSSSIEDSPSFREENIAELREHGCWRSLEEYKGSILSLWLIGLSCPIRDLVIINRDQDITPGMLRDVLSSARPSNLDMTLHETSIFFDPAFVAAFSDSCAHGLTSFRLTLQISSDELRTVDLDLERLLNVVTEMLRSFTVSDLFDLTIGFRELVWIREGRDPFPAELYAQDMDVKALCSTIRDSLPDVETIRVHLLERPGTQGDVVVEMKA